MTTWNTPSSDPSTTPSPTPTPSENPTTAPTTSWDQNTNTSNTTTTQTPTDEGTTSQNTQETKPQSAPNQTAGNTTNKPKTPKVNAISQNAGEALSNAFNANEEIKRLSKENNELKQQIKELTASVNDLTKQLSVSKVSENQPAQVWDRKITVKNNKSDNITETSNEWTEVNAETKTKEKTETQKSSSDKPEAVVPWKSEEKQDKEGSEKSSNNTQQKEEKVWFWRRLGRWIKSWLSKIGSWIATWAKTVGNIVGYVPDKLSHWINFWTNTMSHPNGIFEKIGAVCSRPLRKGIELANLWLAGATKLFKRDSQELKTAWYQFRWKEISEGGKVVPMSSSSEKKKAA